MKNKIYKHIACFLTMVMFTQSVPAESLIAVGERVRETVSGISDTFDDKENNRLNVVDDVISSGADLVKDIVISDAALNKYRDTEPDMEGVPEYVQNIVVRGSYFSCNQSERASLAEYFGVREDTMEICADAGFDIRSSINIAIIMQQLCIGLDDALLMIKNFGSEKKAVEQSAKFRNYQMVAPIFAESEQSRKCVSLLIDGIETGEALNAIKTALVKDTDVLSALKINKGTMDVKNADNKIVLNAEKDKVATGSALKADLSNGHSKNAEDNGTEQLKLEIAKKMYASTLPNFMNDDEVEAYATEGLSALSSEEEEKTNPLFKTGPINAVTSATDYIDINTGRLTYTDVICDIPGVNGLDFKLENRFPNENFGWELSKAKLLNKSHGILLAQKYINAIYDHSTETIPYYIQLANGETYRMRPTYENEEYSFEVLDCYNDYLTFSVDKTNVGGNGVTDVNYQNMGVSRYKLHHMDGRCDYFNVHGDWLSTIDRFGNKIMWTKENGNTVYILSTGEKVIVKDSSYVLPDGTTVSYKRDGVNIGVSTYTDLITSKTIKKPGNKDVTTTFSYSGGSDPNYDKIRITSVRLSSGAIKNYVYGTECLYDYKGNPEKDGSKNQTYGRITETYFSDGNGAVMAKDKYSYDGTYTKKAYYLNNEDTINQEYTYSTSVTNADGLTVKHTFNVKGKETKTEYKSNDVIREVQVKTYQGNNDYPSTIKYTKGTKTNNKTVYTENYTYDKGKITRFSVSLGEKILKDDYYKYDFVVNGDNSTTGYGLLKTKRSIISNNNSENISMCQNYAFDVSHKNVKENFISRNVNYDSQRTYVTHEYFSHDAIGRLTQHRQAYEVNDLSNEATNKYIVTNYAYNDIKNANGTIVSRVVNPTMVTTDNTKTAYTYDSVGRTLTQTLYKDANTGYTTSYEYDIIGNIAKVTNPDESTVISDYDYNSNKITVTDENGAVTVYQYDKYGNLLTVKTAGITTQSNTYNGAMRLATATVGNGNTDYSHDIFGRITYEKSYSGNTIFSEIKTDYEDNTNGLKVKQTAVGDGKDRTITETPDMVTTTQYDVLGNVIEMNDKGSRTTYEYDLMGNMTKSVHYQTNSTDKAMLTTTCTYDVLGNKLSETYAGIGEDGNADVSNTKTYTYDRAGRMLTAADHGDNKTKYTYNAEGWVTKVEVPYTKDSNGVTTYMTTNYTYDKLGNKLTETDGTGRKTSYTYDYRGNVTKAVTGKQQSVYAYDKVGNLISLTTGTGNEAATTRYTYDGLNRQTSVVDALGNSETYTYNGVYLTSKKDRNAITTTYNNDALGRVIKESAGGKARSFTYGRNGLLIKQTDDNTNVTISTRYMDNGQPLTDKVSYGNTSYAMWYTYTNDNQLKEQMLLDGVIEIGTTVCYQYNSAGNLKKVLKGQKVEAEYIYDYEMGTGGKGQVVVAYYNNRNIKRSNDYYKNGAPYGVNNQVKTGADTYATVSEFCCKYSLDGNVSEFWNNKGQKKTYTYSTEGQLASECCTQSGKATTTTYTYDTRGNRIKEEYINNSNAAENYNTTYSYDANNRLLKESKLFTADNIGTVNRYYYDKNGNQTKKTTGTYNTVIRNYNPQLDYPTTLGIYGEGENSGFASEKRTYDAFNRLTKVTSNGTTLGTYTYLPNDLRLSKTVNGNTKYFMWSNDQIVYEFNDNSAITAQYVYGEERICNATNNNYYMYNNHGDVSDIVNANGNIVRTYDFLGADAFGYEKNPDSNDTNPFRYCGEYYDTETGNIYLRARYYDPSVGSFITEDPVRDGVNWYSYCAGNPVMYIDTNGMSLTLYGNKKHNRKIDNQRKEMLSEIQKLTNYELGVDTKGNVYFANTDKNGNPILKLKNGDTEYAHGNALIKGLINNEHVCDVEFGKTIYNSSTATCTDTNAGCDGIGSDVRIIIDKDVIHKIYVEDSVTGAATLEDGRPLYIGIGHELVHGLRGMQGVQHNDLGKDTMIFYKKSLVNGKYVYEKQEKSGEELATVGLFGSYPISENSLRMEHGLRRRICY